MPMQDHCFPVTLSNQIEILLEGLKQQLFSRERKPFDPIWIIVPSHALGQWIMRQFAEDPRGKIFFGFEILTLSSAIESLFPFSFLNPIEWGLKIESEMGFCPFISKEKPLTSAERKKEGGKRASLSLELGKLLHTYAEFAPDELLTWRMGEIEQEKWQKNLYRELCKKDVRCFAFEEAVNRGIFSAEKVPKEIHLFAFHFLSPLKQLFFSEISKITSLHFWVLSPSRFYWGDQWGEKERVKLIRQAESLKAPLSEIEALHQFFEEANALIANNGRLSREWLKTLDAFPLDIREYYSISKETATLSPFQELLVDGIAITPSEPLTLLKALQADLLLLRPSSEKIVLSSLDLSIEIHSAPSIEREVEVLYQNLLRFLKDSPIHPGDILVLVPDLKNYAPYIRLIFGRKESQLEAEISYCYKLEDSSYIQAVVQLLELATSRWELFRVFNFCECPLVEGTFSKADLREVRKFFESQGVSWGVTKKQREAFIEEPSDLSTTWEESFEVFLKRFPLNLSKEEFLSGEADTYSNKTVSLTLLEPLSDFYTFLTALYEDLRILHDEPLWLLAEWSSFLRKVTKKYLNCRSEEDERAHAELHRFFIFIDQCDLSTPLKLSFSGFLIYLKEFFSNEMPLSGEKNRNAIRFIPPISGRAIPSPLIAILGLNEGEFPRCPLWNAMECLEKSHYIPSSADYDRYTFLETALSAREKWILSYTSARSLEPSPLIQELLHDLDERYELGGKAPSEQIVFSHPYFSFDPVYFSKSGLSNYSEKNFKQALALKQLKKSTGAKVFNPPFDISLFEPIEIPKEIMLSDLRQALRNPLRHYLNRGLGIYFPHLKAPERLFHEFEKEAIWESEWLKWALHYPLDRVLELAEKMGKFSIEPFKSLEKARLKNRLKECLSSLEKLTIPPSEVFEIEFVKGIRGAEEIAPNRWKVPAVEVDYRGGRTFITGVLPYASKQGVISFRDESFETYLSSIGEALLIDSLKAPQVDKNFNFLKSGKQRAFGYLGGWQNLLDYYFRVLLQPVPFFPDWIEPFVSSDELALQSQIESFLKDSKKGSQKDPYTDWIFRDKQEIAAIDLMIHWKKHLPEAFKEVYSLWKALE